MSRKKKLPHVLRTNQLKHTFDVIEDPKYMVIFLTIFFCGLRIGEACRLKVEDVDINNKILKIKDAKNPQRKKEGYGKDRLVPIPSVFIPILQLWLEYISGSEWLFPARAVDDKPVCKQMVQKKFASILKSANLYEVDCLDTKDRKMHKYTVHTLRHSYATYLVEKGAPIEKVGSILGHKDIYRTTMIYLHLSKEAKQETVDEVFSNNNFERLVRKKIAEDLPMEKRQEINQNYELELLRERNKNKELRIKELQLLKDFGITSYQR